MLDASHQIKYNSVNHVINCSCKIKRIYYNIYILSNRLSLTTAESVGEHLEITVYPLSYVGTIPMSWKLVCPYSLRVVWSTLSATVCGKSHLVQTEMSSHCDRIGCISKVIISKYGEKKFLNRSFNEVLRPIAIVHINSCRKLASDKSTTRRAYQTSGVSQWPCVGPIHVSPNETTQP